MVCELPFLNRVVLLSDRAMIIDHRSANERNHVECG